MGAQPLLDEIVDDGLKRALGFPGLRDSVSRGLRSSDLHLLGQGYRQALLVLWPARGGVLNIDQSGHVAFGIGNLEVRNSNLRLGGFVSTVCNTEVSKI